MPFSGSVVVFEISNEGLIKPINKIISPNAVQSGRFGAHIHFDGSRLIVGAPNEFSKPGVRGGAAYIYRILEDGRATLLDRIVHPTIQKVHFLEKALLSVDYLWWLDRQGTISPSLRQMLEAFMFSNRKGN